MTVIDLVLRAGLLFLILAGICIIFHIWNKTRNVDFNDLTNEIKRLNDLGNVRCDNGCDVCCKDCADKCYCPGECRHAQDKNAHAEIPDSYYKGHYEEPESEESTGGEKNDDKN